MKTISMKQEGELKEALLSAFNRSSLEQMLRFGCETKLDSIAGNGNLTQVISQVVVWFSETGRLKELVQQATKANPGNPKLKEFVEKLSC